MKETWGTNIVRFSVRAREQVFDEAKEKAAHMGLTFNAYCVAAIAEANEVHGHAPPAEGPPRNARLSRDCDHEPYKSMGRSFCYGCGERIT